jgi:hypothetical protein
MGTRFWLDSATSVEHYLHLYNRHGIRCNALSDWEAPVPEVTVMGQDGHLLEVNGISRGALSPGGKAVPVGVGWVAFAATQSDGTVHRSDDRYILPVNNDTVDLT